MAASHASHDHLRMRVGLAENVIRTGEGAMNEHGRDQGGDAKSLRTCESEKLCLHGRLRAIRDEGDEGFEVVGGDVDRRDSVHCLRGADIVSIVHVDMSRSAAVAGRSGPRPSGRAKGTVPRARLRPLDGPDA